MSKNDREYTIYLRDLTLHNSWSLWDSLYLFAISTSHDGLDQESEKLKGPVRSSLLPVPPIKWGTPYVAERQRAPATTVSNALAPPFQRWREHARIVHPPATNLGIIYTQIFGFLLFVSSYTPKGSVKFKFCPLMNPEPASGDLTSRLISTSEQPSDLLRPATLAFRFPMCKVGQWKWDQVTPRALPLLNKP